MPKVSDEHVQERKRQILDAATASFARSGIHGSTMDDICAGAGLSKGAVYGYFKSKDDIVAALKVEGTQRDASVIRWATHQQGVGRALPELLTAAFASLADEANQTLQRATVMLWSEALLSQQVLDAQLLESQLWSGALELLVEQAQARGSVSSDADPSTLGTVLAATLYGASAMKQWQPDLDTAAMGEAILSLLSGSTGATGSAS